MANTIACQACGLENDSELNFCLGCGSALKREKPPATIGPTVSCPACGSAVPAGGHFCGKCGAAAKGTTPHAGLTAQAHLVLINPDGSSGAVIPLSPGDNVFGRTTGHAAFRDDPFLSPSHAAFNFDGNSLRVRDLGSLNGVYFRIVTTVEIEHGDQLRLGRQALRFEVLAMCDPEPSEDDASPIGAPWADAWGRLARVAAPDVVSEAFLLRHPEEIVGRELGNVVIRDDGFISGRHARITVSGGRYYLEDLRSSNGTFLRVRGGRTLRDGDLLLLGQQPLRAVIPTGRSNS